jgi:hypothetical protein
VPREVLRGLNKNPRRTALRTFQTMFAVCPQLPDITRTLVLEKTGMLSDVYCGNVVFLGETRDGDEGNVPQHLIDLAQQLFGLEQEAV